MRSLHRKKPSLHGSICWTWSRNAILSMTTPTLSPMNWWTSRAWSTTAASTSIWTTGTWPSVIIPPPGAPPRRERLTATENGASCSMTWTNASTPTATAGKTGKTGWRSTRFSTNLLSKACWPMRAFAAGFVFPLWISQTLSFLMKRCMTCWHNGAAAAKRRS